MYWKYETERDVYTIFVENKFREWKLIREIREIYGPRNISTLRDIGEGEEACELVPAAWIPISLSSVAITIHEIHHIAEFPVSFN